MNTMATLLQRAGITILGLVLIRAEIDIKEIKDRIELLEIRKANE